MDCVSKFMNHWFITGINVCACRIFFFQKLHDRASALNKSSLPEKQRKKWMSVITLDFMSSEESGSENESCLVKKELPWRSDKVTKFFSELDDFVGGSKSNVAKRQTRPRVLDGAVSSREIPQGKKIPSWALCQQ